MQYQRGVSVIVPCYNREQYLKECIQSILDQKCDFPVEIIVADDGSTDTTVEVAQTFQKHSLENPHDTAVLVLEKPADCQIPGAGPARNRGIVRARYSYIAFLDSDDIFLPGHLDRLFNFLEQHSEFGGVVDQISGFDVDINKRWLMPYPDTGTVRPESLLLYTYFYPSVSMFRHTVLDEQEGPFYEPLRISQDQDLVLRILMDHQIAILPEDGAGLREHAGRTVLGRKSRHPQSKWIYNEMVFNRAIARYSFPKKVIRKRRAILHFRLAQDDLFERRYFSAVWRVCCAFFLDPVRAVHTIWHRNFRYW
jgi:glycosyltransferase involved in cell wall biosynthesis